MELGESPRRRRARVPGGGGRFRGCWAASVGVQSPRTGPAALPRHHGMRLEPVRRSGRRPDVGARPGIVRGEVLRLRRAPGRVRVGLPHRQVALDFARDVGIPAWDDRVGFAPQQRTKMFFGSWTDKVAFEEEDPILMGCAEGRGHLLKNRATQPSSRRNASALVVSFLLQYPYSNVSPRLSTRRSPSSRPRPRPRPTPTTRRSPPIPPPTLARPPPTRPRPSRGRFSSSSVLPRPPQCTAPGIRHMRRAPPPDGQPPRSPRRRHRRGHVPGQRHSLHANVREGDVPITRPTLVLRVSTREFDGDDSPDAQRGRREREPLRRLGGRHLELGRRP